MRPVFLLTLLAIVAAWALPTLGSARTRSPRTLAWAPEPPALLGSTGGVLRLQAPRSPMVLLRGAQFTMGSNPEAVLEAQTECKAEPGGHACEESAFSDEMPRRRVAVSSFWLDRTEVTVEQYARCVALRRCRAISFFEGARRFDRPRFPASLVTWEDAARYCSFRQARLPTEAEFERAARGLRGRKYPWGSLYNSHAANHGKLSWEATDSEDGFAELAPVGAFPAGATPEGVLDLAGNVEEWVRDRYAPEYDPRDLQNPIGPGTAAGSVRILRGGGYQSPAYELRAASRVPAEPTTRRPDIGFRCAKSVRERPSPPPSRVIP